jgi:hypothetical protein
VEPSDEGFHRAMVSSFLLLARYLEMMPLAVCLPHCSLTKDGQTRPTPRECLQQEWVMESSKHKVNMPQWIRDVWGWDNARGRTQLSVAGAEGYRRPSAVRENSAVRVGTSDQGA